MLAGMGAFGHRRTDISVRAAFVLPRISDKVIIFGIVATGEWFTLKPPPSE